MGNAQARRRIRLGCVTFTGAVAKMRHPYRRFHLCSCYGNGNAGGWLHHRHGSVSRLGVYAAGTFHAPHCQSQPGCLNGASAYCQHIVGASGVVHHSKIGRSCPLWVISRQSGLLGLCPLYPRKRTKSRPLGMSALCQKRTNAPQQNFLFDHRAERSGAHRTKNRRLCGARAKRPAEVAGPKSYSADLV